MSAEELRAKIREVPDFPKPGILFYDITTLLKDAAAYKEAIDLMLAPYKGEAIDIVVGMESRGFIFSAPMAYLLDVGSRPRPQAGQAAGRDDHGRICPRVRLEHARDPPRRDRPGSEGPDRRRPARDRRHGPRHDRTGRAAQGRGGRPCVPGRARVPQGPRPARGQASDQRHQVLTDRPASRSQIDRPLRRSQAEPAARRGGVERVRRRSDRRGALGRVVAGRHAAGRHAAGRHAAPPPPRPRSTSAGAGSSGRSPVS